MVADIPVTALGDEGVDPKRWLALAVIAIAQLMIVLDATVVNIALPSIQRSLHISLLDRQWVITAYTLSFGGLLLLGGRIADFIGRKRIFIIGLLGFAGASALGGLAQNSAMLFSARAIQGCFGAIMAPAALSIITVTFTEPKERAKAFGVYGAIAGGGAAIGLLAGGVLTEYATWRWCLLVNVPIALIAVVGGLLVVRESRADGDRHYDLPGAFLSSAGLVALVYGFTKANQDSWSSPVTLAFVLGAVVLLVTFVLYEQRIAHPLLPMRVVLDGNRGGSYLSSFIAGIGLFGMFLFLTYYLQGTLHYSALRCGFAFLPFSGGIIIAAGLSSQLLPKVGPRPLMITGFTMGAAGLLWLLQIGQHTSFVEAVLPAEIVMSLGLGLAFVPLSSTALVGVGRHDAGVASALVNTTQQVGGSLGTALLNTIALSATTAFARTAGSGIAAQADSLIHGYKVAFIVSASLLVVAALVTAALVRASSAELVVLEESPALV
jgi:EmrB/QacA subfamily drug resistance transporter